MKFFEYKVWFKPVALADIGKFRKIFEQFGFTSDTDRIKKKILVKFKDPNVGMHDFDENGEVFRISLSQNKWFMEQFYLHKGQRN